VRCTAAILGCPAEYDSTVPEIPFTPGAGSHQRSGIVFAILAYGLWGILPAYFLLLQPAGAIEIVAWRILFSLVFCAITITVTRKWPLLFRMLGNRRLVLSLGIAAILIFANWQIYVFAALSGHVLEAALGYFINPIVTILLGVLVLRERMRPLQWAAVGISVVAVVILTVNYGAFPWISIGLALSFGLYGLVKKRVGNAVDALSGLTIETAWLVPLAVAEIVVVAVTGGITFGTVSIAHTLLLLSAGVVTAIPLLLFAAAARRLTLVHLGLVQYLAPVLQFLFGAFVLHEAMPTGRWIGFALVWLALVVLSVHMLRTGRSARRASPLPG
jgi:chloramphenicol-sensitive protein RarD